MPIVLPILIVDMCRRKIFIREFAAYSIFDVKIGWNKGSKSSTFRTLVHQTPTLGTKRMCHCSIPFGGRKQVTSLHDVQAFGRLNANQMNWTHATIVRAGLAMAQGIKYNISCCLKLDSFAMTCAFLVYFLWHFQMPNVSLTTTEIKADRSFHTNFKVK